MITSLALNHTPDQVHIYILDYGGQSHLKVLESFPHVGAVITRLESERTERLLGYLSVEILRRSALMRKAKVDDWGDYNDQVNQNEQLPAIFLIIDGFLNLKDAFESAISKKIVMLVGGQSAGIYLAISSYTQTDLPNELLANINSRISFYQANSNEYQGIVGFPSEACLQEDAVLGMRPGRGLVRSTTPLAFQAALPTYGENDKELAENISTLSCAMQNAWLGKRTPPEIYALEEFIYLPPIGQEKNKRDFRVEIGFTYQDLRPIGFSLSQDSNAFLISSTSPGCGKTTFLQMWMIQLAEKYPFDQLEMKIIGFHSQSLGAFKSLPNVKIIRVKPALQDFLNEIEKIVEKRKLDLESRIQSEVDKFDQISFLRQYYHILIIIDDYSKFSASINDNERTQLVEILQNGDDVGISFIIADSMADLPKPFQDSFIQKVTLSGCGVLLGGADGIDLFNNARITPGQPSIGLPAGRGYLIRRGRVNLFQAGVWWQQNEDPENTIQHRLANIIEK
jgi:S-DNA-T family DNA segregation ATPase FtsK/SpoIIIE